MLTPPKYPRLFSPITIGKGKGLGFTLKNRIVQTPVVTQMCDDTEGFVSRAHIDFYRSVAESGVGMVQIEAMGVDDKPSGRLLRISDDRHIDGLRRLADTIHECGARCTGQLVAWLKTSRKGYHQEPHELTVDEIKRMVESFVLAAERCKRAGIDAVDLHCAHYYALASFISARANKRDDDWGGTVENRLRIVKEIILGARQLCGDEYVYGCRINGDEFIAGGNTLKHTRQIVQYLESWGFDFIGVSAGGRYEDGDWYRGYSGRRAMPTAEMPDCTNVYLAEDLKKRVSIPIITAGKIRNLAQGEEILERNQADLVGYCRPFICDPTWLPKSLEGREREAKWCTYCNNCIDKDRMFMSIDCPQWGKERFKGDAGKFEAIFKLVKAGYNYQLEIVENILD